jgi:DNA repair exonuclease SbcCD ATPase subunit
MRHAERKPQVNQSDYIRNLQQQIYLLELETRYMKAGKKGGKTNYTPGSMHSLRGGGGSMMIPPAASMHGLDQEDEREDSEEYESMKKEFQQQEQKLKNQIVELQANNNELQACVKQWEGILSSLEKNMQDKDALHGEIITLKAKMQELEATIQHQQLNLNRSRQEKEENDAKLLDLKSEHQKSDQKIQEQLDINSHLQSSLEKVQVQAATQAQIIQNWEQKFKELNLEGYQKQVKELQQQVAEASADRAHWELERQALKQHQEAMKQELSKALQKSKTFELQLQAIPPSPSVQNVEPTRNEMEQRILLENEIKMLKIQCHTKDATISNLSAQIKTLEQQNLKHSAQLLETQDKLQHLESVYRARQHEYVQLGQDKRYELLTLLTTR